MAYHENSSDHNRKSQTIDKQIDQSLEQMVKNNDLNKYLDVASKFPRYSVNNTMLLYAQNPNASKVQSYSEWRAEGRQVEAGEKGMTLLKAEFKRQEVPRIDPTTRQPVLNEKGQPVQDIKHVRDGFSKAKVFDISQTKGLEQDNFREAVREDVSARSADMYKNLYNRLNERPAVSQNVNLSASPEFSNQAEFKQLIQNYAKEQLQQMNPSDPMMEQKAEATKVIVAKHYNMVEPGYQSDLSSWAKDANGIRKTLEDVSRISGNVIREMDHLNRERVQEMKQERPLNKSEERLVMLQAAQKEAQEIRTDFMKNPEKFKNEPTDEMKVLLVYANRMENKQPISPELSDAYTKIQDKLDRKFDEPGIENSARWKMVEYISKYEKAGGLEQAAKDVQKEQAADRADTAQSSKGKSDELER